uniref:Uncharacterized protein n=1 Tax=Romanomermis culicivorax TaxID=13658 RepID=A0A915LAC1_ROMCU
MEAKVKRAPKTSGELNEYWLCLECETFGCAFDAPALLKQLAALIETTGCAFELTALFTHNRKIIQSFMR